jgi:predicted lipid-binding transport protein (Tim44 family)
MHVDLDILVYAVIAALILGRLWASFGSRNEDETQRPNPFAPRPQTPPDATFTAPSQALARMQPSLPPPASLAGGLALVTAAIPSFDEKQFLQIARDIFTTVVTAYASGSMNSLSGLVSPALIAQFQQAANARTTAGQSAQTRVARIKDAEVTAARTESKQALITVTFVSEQENILRDASGTIIGGKEGALEEVTDIWTFARDTQTPDTKWSVVETRG